MVDKSTCACSLHSVGLFYQSDVSYNSDISINDDINVHTLMLVLLRKEAKC